MTNELWEQLGRECQAALKDATGRDFDFSGHAEAFDRDGGATVWLYYKPWNRAVGQTIAVVVTREQFGIAHDLVPRSTGSPCAPAWEAWTSGWKSPWDLDAIARSVTSRGKHMRPA